MRYLVVIDGAGEYGGDYSVVEVEANTRREAVEIITSAERGWGKAEDGIALVFTTGSAAVFTINDTTQKVIATATLDKVGRSMILETDPVAL